MNPGVPTLGWRTEMADLQAHTMTQCVTCLFSTKGFGVEGEEEGTKYSLMGDPCHLSMQRASG